MSEIRLDDLAEDWAAVKLMPQRIGLPHTVWITENQGYSHDMRVKVSRVHGRRGTWPDAVSVGLSQKFPRPIYKGIALGRTYINPTMSRNKGI
jgi:hypothetical protein